MYNVLPGDIASIPVHVCAQHVIKEAAEDIEGIRIARLVSNAFLQTASDLVKTLQCDGSCDITTRAWGPLPNADGLRIHPQGLPARRQGASGRNSDPDAKHTDPQHPDAVHGLFERSPSGRLQRFSLIQPPEPYTSSRVLDPPLSLWAQQAAAALSTCDRMRRLKEVRIDGHITTSDADSILSSLLELRKLQLEVVRRPRGSSLWAPAGGLQLRDLALLTDTRDLYLIIDPNVQLQLDLQALTSTMKQLTKLRLAGVQPHNWRSISSLTNLQALSISHTYVHTVQPLAQLPSLHTFLCDWLISHKAWPKLAAMTQLNTLQAMGICPDLPAPASSSITRLETLIDGAVIHDADNEDDPWEEEQQEQNWEQEDEEDWGQQEDENSEWEEEGEQQEDEDSEWEEEREQQEDGDAEWEEEQQEDGEEEALEQTEEEEVEGEEEAGGQEEDWEEEEDWEQQEEEEHWDDLRSAPWARRPGVQYDGAFTQMLPALEHCTLSGDWRGGMQGLATVRALLGSTKLKSLTINNAICEALEDLSWSDALRSMPELEALQLLDMQQYEYGMVLGEVAAACSNLTSLVLQHAEGDYPEECFRRGCASGGDGLALLPAGACSSTLQVLHVPGCLGILAPHLAALAGMPALREIVCDDADMVWYSDSDSDCDEADMAWEIGRASAEKRLQECMEVVQQQGLVVSELVSSMQEDCREEPSLRLVVDFKVKSVAVHCLV